MNADTLNSGVSPIHRQITHSMTRTNRNQICNACTDHDADNTMTVHNECKEGAEHHRSHSKTTRVKVLQSGHVRSCAAATAKSLKKLTCRLALARTLLVQIFRTPMTNAATHCYFTQSWLLSVPFINSEVYARVRHHAPTDPPRFP